MTDRRGLVPYLFYDDVAAALDWYRRAFGFEENSRWEDDAGNIMNAEIRIDETEIWLDGSGKRDFGDDQRPIWIGVWVQDVDAMYERVQSAGIDCEEPADKEYGVRTFNVADEFGHLWGFMRRLPK